MIPPALNDRDLVDGMLRGEERAFRAFFDSYFPRVYRFALRRLAGDPETAQEVAQTTLTRAMRGLASFRHEAALFTWLCQICRHEIAGLLRSRARHSDVVVLLDDDVQTQAEVAAAHALASEEPERHYTTAQTRQLVHEVLDQLPSRFGDVLEWKYVEGRSVDEIGTLLGTSQVAAQSMLARARNAFREALEKKFGRAPDDVVRALRTKR